MRDIVNAADRRGGGVAPGEIVVLFPAGIGPESLAEWPTIFPRTPQDLKYLRQQPRWASIGGTSIFFDGIPAPVVYAVRGEVETIVPYEVARRKVTQVVVNYEGNRRRVQIPVVDSAPAIFAVDPTGHGQASMLNETGCCNSARNPAVAGSIASLYATGEGRDPGAVKVTVGGLPAEVLYADNLGMLVVNFRIPEKAPTGKAVPLMLTVAGHSSSDAVTMAIRPVKRRVLVLDRQTRRRNRLMGILASEGYELLTTKGDSVDLVITDSGDEIATIQNDNPLVKVVTEGVPLRTADLFGANLVIQEPFDEDKLRVRLRDLLTERPARY